MVHYELLRDEGILIIRPEGSLEASDYQNIAKEIDLIDVESFPGWKDFAAPVAHLRFVKDHHRNIDKTAAVSDSSFLAIAPKVASHFVQADVRHFTHS